MAGGISPRHAQNPLSGERRKTLSITHHTLSPPPSHHHLYIIHLINWLQIFYRIIMSLKRPFVPKSDVKQWFTTTKYSPTTPPDFTSTSFRQRTEGPFLISTRRKKSEWSDSAMLFVRRPWHSGISRWPHSGLPMRDTKAIHSSLHYAAHITVITSIFLVTGLIAIHRHAEDRRQLKKKRFHFYFFSWRV